jgi:hypothetical protein
MLMRGARNVSPLACIRWHPSGYPLDPKGTYLVRLAQHESRRGAAILREARAGLQHRQPGETSNTKHKAQSTKHKAGCRNLFGPDEGGREQDVRIIG